MPHRLGTIGIAGIGWFIVAVLALHALEPGFDPVTDWISDYASGESFGWVMNTAFIAAGIGTLAIGLGLRSILPPGKRVKATWVLLLVAGVSFVVVGLFNGDVTTADDLTPAGAVHTLASLVLFVTLLVAAWMLRGVVRRNESWRRPTTSATVFAILLSLGFVGVFVTPEGGPVGVSQRIFVGVMMAWLLSLAWTVRSVESDPVVDPDRASRDAAGIYSNGSRARRRRTPQSMNQST